MKNIKRIISIVLMICIMTSLITALSIDAFAETEIKTITLTGDITPVSGSEMTFAKAVKSDDYIVVQAWMDMEKGKYYVDNADGIKEFLGSLSEDQLLPEGERKFVSGKTYMYMTSCILKSDSSATISSDINIIVGEYNNLFKMYGNTKQAAFGYIFCPDSTGTHTHIADLKYQNDAVYHWYKCREKDCNFVFEYTKIRHDAYFDTGICEDCGYKVEKKTTIIKQPQDITNKVVCGDTIEFSVEADGAELTYEWRGSSNFGFSDTDNYLNTGTKISGSKTKTIRFENINKKFADKYLGVYCCVSGLRGGPVTNGADIKEITHNSKIVTPIDEINHMVKCTCNETVKASEAHTFKSGVCEVCGYKEGSIKTEFSSATLTLPDFDTEHKISDVIKTATLSGIGTKDSGISKIEFLKYGTTNVLDGNYNLSNNKDTGYITRVYPKLKDSFYMTENNSINTSYQGVLKRSTVKKDVGGNLYFEVELGKANVVRKMIFKNGGGTGEQAPVKADEHNSVYFPECTFTKSGDEFFAWRYNDKLYYPDTKNEIPVYIQEEEACATAVWKSQLTKYVSIKMDPLKNGMKVSDTRISASYPEECRISSVTWYDEDEGVDGVTDDLGLKMSVDDKLSEKKNYNVKVTVYGPGFAADDNLYVRLNDLSMTDCKRNGAQYITFVLHIVGDVEVTVPEPIVGEELPRNNKMSVNNSNFYISNGTAWYNSPYAQTWLPYDTVAEEGKTYYLSLLLKRNESAAKNTMLFTNGLKINGKYYQHTGYSDSGMAVKVPYTSARVKITEKDGYIFVNVCEDMKATFVMSLYNPKNLLKELIWKDVDMKKGENNIFSSLESDFMKLDKIIYRNLSDTVKVMIFDSNLKPLSEAHNYKYIEKRK